MAEFATMSARAKIGIVTVSDRASRGEYEDRGGEVLVPPLCRCSHARFLQEAARSGR